MISLHASFAGGCVDFIPSVAAGRSCVSIEIGFSEPAPAGSEIAILAREIFGGNETARRIPIVGSGNDETHLHLPPGELPLSPGCWLLTFELVKEDRSLSSGGVGCVLVYARKRGESDLHTKACYNMARVEFAYDREYGVYHKAYRSVLPGTGDPLDEGNVGRMLDEYITEQSTWPELQHDGGLGFLYGAHVLRALGEVDRGRYCEEVLRRTVRVILSPMNLGDGRLAGLDGSAGKRAHLDHCRQQDGFALKLLCQSYFYFRFGLGSDPKYGREVLESSSPLFEYQMSGSLEPGCGECGCRVYDGRILAGIAWYSLARRAEDGSYPEGVDKVVECARSMAGLDLENAGWYDAGCLVEGRCHVWCGNMNLLNGLLPARRILLDPHLDRSGIPSDAFDDVDAGIREAFRFLTSTNGYVTGGPAFVPTRTSQWAAGNMYEICDEFLRRVGEDPGVRQLMNRLVLGSPSKIVNCFHRNNASAAAILHCDEFRKLDPSPELPWDNLPVDWRN